MFTDNNALNLIAQAEIALLEAGELVNNGPKFRIIHRFHKQGTLCEPGEEVAAIFLLEKAREILVPFSLSLRLLFNYLAEGRRIPQSATQIAAGIHTSLFYTKHGFNAGPQLHRKITRSAIKEYIGRSRSALNIALVSAALPIDSSRVIMVQRTSGNEVLYRLRAKVEWIHLD